MKFSRLLIACISLTAFMGMAVSAQEKAPVSNYKIVGYYTAWSAKRGFPASNIRGDLLTHINYAFAGIKNGEITIVDPKAEISEAHNFRQLRKLKVRYPHLKTLISIGGWKGSKEFSDIALTPASRAKFADSAVSFIRRYHFDGVDIDWEFPVSGGAEGNIRRPEDKQNYTLLFQSLREKLDAAGKKDRHAYLLTTAASSYAPFLSNTEMDKVAAILDFVNLMTYDFSGPWDKIAGHVAPLYNDPSIQRKGDNPQSNVSSSVDLMIKAGVPPEKIVLGMPLYGYAWRQCDATDHGQRQPCAGTGRGTWEPGALGFSDIDEKLINKDGFVRYWNDTAKVPYLFNDATREFITYDDPDSFAEKIAFLKSRKLAGAMLWEISADRKFVLQKTVAHELGVQY